MQPARSLSLKVYALGLLRGTSHRARNGQKSIVEAIDQCKLMVLIFSSSANQSRQVHREVQQAFDGEKPVVPFRIEKRVFPKDTALLYGVGPLAGCADTASRTTSAKTHDISLEFVSADRRGQLPSWRTNSLRGLR